MQQQVFSLGIWARSNQTSHLPLINYLKTTSLNLYPHIAFKAASSSFPKCLQWLSELFQQINLVWFHSSAVLLPNTLTQLILQKYKHKGKALNTVCFSQFIYLTGKASKQHPRHHHALPSTAPLGLTWIPAKGLEPFWSPCVPRRIFIPLNWSAASVLFVLPLHTPYCTTEGTQ